MSYAIKPLSCDPSRVRGISERLIVSPYENNYCGAVKCLNFIVEQLAGLDPANAPGYLICRQAHSQQACDSEYAICVKHCARR